jgi:uncharacterized membrane protein YhaH (DUF805 family)
MKWYLKVLRQYADFRGRAGRKEFWMFTMFNFIGLVIVAVIDAAAGLEIISLSNTLYGILTLIYAAAMFLPSMAAGVRRLHDTGKSGWWMLLALIFFLGWIACISFTTGKNGSGFLGLLMFFGLIAFIVRLAKDGNKRTNQYGPDPKGRESEPLPVYPEKKPLRRGIACFIAGAVLIGMTATVYFAVQIVKAGLTPETYPITSEFSVKKPVKFHICYEYSTDGTNVTEHRNKAKSFKLYSFTFTDADNGNKYLSHAVPPREYKLWNREGVILAEMKIPTPGRYKVDFSGIIGNFASTGTNVNLQMTARDIQPELAPNIVFLILTSLAWITAVIVLSRRIRRKTPD